MNPFKKFSGQDKKPVEPAKSKAVTACILLFDALPAVDKNQLVKIITQIEPLKRPVTLDIQIQEKDRFYAFIKFDDHQLKLFGMPTPVPASIMERTIQVSNWKQEDKLPLQNHKAQIICYYEGENPNPTEQLLALYKTAYAFANFGLLGILDEDAWNCMPAWMIKEQMQPNMLQSCRESVPLGVWTGFVKFKKKNDIWYCTKGYHRFGINDLAYLGHIGEATDAYNMFGNLFQYMLGGAAIKAGHTAQISATHYLRFGEVYEYHDYLNSPLGTLVFEKISASQVNKSS